MRDRSHLWLTAIAVILATFIVAALVLPRSYALTAICDITDSLLLASGAASFAPVALRSRGRMRLFWSLIILGLTLWLSYQLLWTYYEVVLRRDVPDLYAGDIVLFLDIVPLIAALALRPHAAEDEYAARSGRLDFALLLLWWAYIYVLIVIPWQYVEPSIPAYNRDLDWVYLVEKLAFLAGLVACWITSKGQWRSLYAGLFGMSFTYVASSTIANWAISRNVYYTGSFYDVPLSCAIAWLTWIGLRTGPRAQPVMPSPDEGKASTIYGVWIARCSMIAVFSLPLFAAWAMADGAVPSRIRIFRITLTLMASFVMGVMVLMRQHLLDRELVRLLNRSQESVDNLRHLQAQILQSEKVASIGQLVGGAAHELNNPITAMLGYSDLLLSTPLTAEQQPIAARIGQYVRRTRLLVASLISFARQAPAPKTPLDLSTLARTAVKLTQPQWEAVGLEVRTQFDPALPKVLGDSNQLLQVCLQLVAKCLHVLGDRHNGVLTVITQRQGDKAVLQIATEPIPSSDLAMSQEDGPEDTVGLSACRGILQEHYGQISCESHEHGIVLLRVELPAVGHSPSRAPGSTMPGLLSSRPYA